MKILRKLLAVVLLSSFASFGQATSNGSTLTVTNASTGAVLYELNITLSGGYAGPGTGLGAPVGVPVKIKISSAGTSINPYFITGDMNGNCDSYQIGSMNATNTEFTTILNSCCTPIAEGYANGIHFELPVKCYTPGGTTNCITYSKSICCDMNCITFNLPTNLPLCRRSYSVTIGFTDGTQATISVNFAIGNTLMFCYTKPITDVISSTFGNCNCTPTGPQPRLVEAPPAEVREIENRIIVSPNPTKSLIDFGGQELERYTITIFDTNGNIIIQNAKINTTINIENQKPGIYLYAITDDHGYTQSGKIIKN